MLIAIDFDETLTKDPQLWRWFYQIAAQRGHRLICVTARRQTADNVDLIDEWLAAQQIDLPVYFTSLGSKVAHMAAIGLNVDIWIDDDPKTCAMGH